MPLNKHGSTVSLTGFRTGCLFSGGVGGVTELVFDTQERVLRDVPCPGVHDLAALLQQVGAAVGGFDGVLDDMR